MINAIIFDAYGTLISTGTGSVDASREIFVKIQDNAYRGNRKSRFCTCGNNSALLAYVTFKANIQPTRRNGKDLE